MVMISERPVEAMDRIVPGHWEGDLIMGRGHLRAIGTLVERTTRYVVLLNLVNGYSADLQKAVMHTKFAGIPEHLCRSLTWDQETEMSGHAAFTAETGISVYFCQPQSPWERGTNENTNGLLRQYFPKGVDLAGVTQARLNAVARQLNERPRRILEWGTAAMGVGVVVAIIVRFVFFYPRHAKALERTQRSYTARARKVAALALDLFDDPEHTERDVGRLHHQLGRLNEAALMIDAQLGNPSAWPTAPRASCCIIVSSMSSWLSAISRDLQKP